MAYVIYCEDKNPSQFSRIATDAAERDKHLHGTMRYHEISQSDFNDLRNNLKVPSGWDGTNISYTNNSPINDEHQLTQVLDNLKETCEIILRGQYAFSVENWQTYLNYLNTVDTSTINFPIDSWEKYCSDNSITFESLLQRP